MDVNLDGFTSPNELLDFFSKYHRPTREDAEQLFGAKPTGYVRTAKDLANYAMNKAAAMRCRERGDVQTALSYESICERIYKALPDYARW
jgi:hypothetical protein